METAIILLIGFTSIVVAFWILTVLDNWLAKNYNRNLERFIAERKSEWKR